LTSRRLVFRFSLRRWHISLQAPEQVLLQGVEETIPKCHAHVKGDHVADCHSNIDDGQHLARRSDQAVCPLYASAGILLLDLNSMVRLSCMATPAAPHLRNAGRPPIPAQKDALAYPDHQSILTALQQTAHLSP
jgi:hypothetical protein